MSMGSEMVTELAVVLLAAALGGWLCRKAGLSTVVGYLLAGVLIGPLSPFAPLLDDPRRVEALAQLGLVFLMFDIGRRLGWQRLRQLGFAMIAGAALGAALVFNAGRALALLCGWHGIEGLFFAALLVVSSSAIIGKVLEETGTARERPGQLALGVTVLEDIVAVVLLAVLGTVAMPETAPAREGGGVGGILGGLGLFIVFVFLTALFLVPRLLASLGKGRSREVEAVGVAGMLLGMSALTIWAGYSAGLGAFLLGSIIGSTKERGEVARFIAGSRDIFGAVFFVATGMMFDLRALVEIWHMAAGLTLAAMALRWLLVGSALVLAGQAPRDAFRSGLVLTPLGEFSFIIAHLAVVSGTMPEWFFALAVSMSVGSSLIAPPLIRRADNFHAAIARFIPGFIKHSAALYAGYLSVLKGLLDGSAVWKLAGWRLWQTGIEMVAATALLAGGGAIHRWAESAFGRDFLIPHGLSILFAGALAFLAVIPLLAIWRNIEAISMILAEAVSKMAGGGGRAVLQSAFRVAALLLMLLWIAAIIPGDAGGIASVALLLAGVISLLLFRSRMIRWHSLAEIELGEILAKSGEGRNQTLDSLDLDPGKEWAIDLREVKVRDHSRAAGLKLSDLPLRGSHNTSIAAVERQGMLVPNPKSDFEIYPGDRLLLIGRRNDIDAAERWLDTPAADDPEPDGGFDDLRLATCSLHEGCAAAGRTLGEIAAGARFGVQIVGIERDGGRVLNPGADFRLAPGDGLLILSNSRAAAEFSRWLACLA